MTVITPELLRRFDVSGPRYTSYPTADRFVEAFGQEEYTLALQQRKLATPAKAQPLSLYIHIPFCESLCYYCACNKIITKHHDRAEVYLRYLAREIDLHTAHCDLGQVVSQLHLGGGTPTFLSDEELRDLMGMLRRSFTLIAGGEYSIEVDPRTVTPDRLALLAELGFNRLSFGVQDFDPDVQKAVHRIQPAQQVFDLVAAARRLGFDSVNVDLIYGLPNQTPESFARTLAQVNELRPDRIALYAYAHLPERFKPQRRIIAIDLPGAPNKVAMLARSLAAFEAAGYVYIGMDHFALPTDALAVAKRQGRLHRNFQGYCSHDSGDLIALGVSSISSVGSVYAQNEKSLEAYYARLMQGELPIARGISLRPDDFIRRDVIQSLMCNFRLWWPEIDAKHGISSTTYFAEAIE